MRLGVMISVVMACLPVGVSLAGPLRCVDDGDGGACVWGRVEAYDGSVLQVRGLSLRPIGMIVPSQRDLCANKTSKDEFACGRPARKRMGELVAKGVACDIVDATSDGLLARCKVADGDLSRLMVQAGVARAAKDGPLDAEQAAAMAAKRGLWAADMVPPKDWDQIRRKAERE